MNGLLTNYTNILLDKWILNKCRVIQMDFEQMACYTNGF